MGMTSVYAGFNPTLMIKRPDVHVKHLVLPQRYDAAQPPGIQATLKTELAAGRVAVKQFVLEQYHTRLQERG